MKIIEDMGGKDNRNNENDWQFVGLGRGAKFISNFERKKKY